jgi:hypothetical protein
MIYAVDDGQEPQGRDLRPYPETPEAKALGCRCSLVRNPDGKALLDQDGRLIYSLAKGCPIRNHNVVAEEYSSIIDRDGIIEADRGSDQEAPIRGFVEVGQSGRY